MDSAAAGHRAVPSACHRFRYMRGNDVVLVPGPIQHGHGGGAPASCQAGAGDGKDRAADVRPLSAEQTDRDVFAHGNDAAGQRLAGDFQGEMQMVPFQRDPCILLKYISCMHCSLACLGRPESRRVDWRVFASGGIRCAAPLATVNGTAVLPEGVEGRSGEFVIVLSAYPVTCEKDGEKVRVSVSHMVGLGEKLRKYVRNNCKRPVENGNPNYRYLAIDIRRCYSYLLGRVLRC